MADESERYNLSAIRDLLLAACNAEELQELFYFSENPDLREVVHQFVLPGDSKRAMVRKAVRYCESRSLLGEMLAEVARANPRKYQELEPRLLRGDAPPLSPDAAAEAAKQAARERAERLEREQQERKAAERRQAQLEDLYRQATAQLETRDWAGARELLTEIQKKEPGYRNTLDLLDRADTKLVREEQVVELMAQGLGHLDAGKWWLANQAFRQVLALAPDHAEALAGLAEADSQEQFASRLVAGQNALRAGRWSEAISHFEAVLKMEPAHQEATKLLAEAQAQDRTQREAEARRQAEQRAKREAEARQAEVARQEAEARAKREEEARQAELFRLYYAACMAAWAKDWPKAIENFEALLLRDLNYRDAADRLKEVRSLRFRDQFLRPGTTEQTEDLFGLRSTRNEALRLRGLQAPLLPKMGPRPPEDVLARQREIQAAGTPQSQKKVAGKPAAAPKPAEWRTLAKLEGHTKTVERAAFSPDGKRVVTASEDKTARLWQTMTGKSLVKLRGHSDTVFCAAFSPDGTLVVTASSDGRARLWQAATGNLVTELRVHAKILGMGWSSVLSAAFSPDGRLVATASGKVRLWAVATGEMVAELDGDNQSAVRVAFSPDGEWLIAGGEDGRAWIREVATGKVIAELRGHTGALREVAVSPDGKRVVTAGEDDTVRIWEAATGKAVRTLRVSDDFGVWGAALHPNGRWVIAATFGKAARVWDIATGNVVAVLRGHANYVVSAAFSPDGKCAVTGSHDRTARVWEVPQA